MVSCPACGRDLPYDCICCGTREERLDAYLRQLAREVELVKLVICGYRPTIEVAFFDDGERELRRERHVARVVETDTFEFDLRVDTQGPQGAVWMEAILYDADGRILFRRRLRSDFAGEVTLNWHIGIPRTTMRVW